MRNTCAEEGKGDVTFLLSCESAPLSTGLVLTIAFWHIASSLSVELSVFSDGVGQAADGYCVALIYCRCPCQLGGRVALTLSALSSLVGTTSVPRLRWLSIDVPEACKSILDGLPFSLSPVHIMSVV